MFEHKLNNVFAGIDMQISALERMFPALLEGYKVAQSNHLLTQSFTPKQLYLLGELVADLSADFEYLKSVIRDR